MSERIVMVIDDGEGIEDPARLGALSGQEVGEAIRAVERAVEMPTPTAAAVMLAGVLSHKHEQENQKGPSYLLRLYGDPALTSRCMEMPDGAAPATALSKWMKKEISTSRYGLPPGLAITANQAGVMARFCIARKDGEFVTMINPVILATHGEPVYMSEGCLSIPGYRIPVRRFERLTVRYRDEDGNEHTIEAKDQFAQIVQHELDHMNGKLIIDGATRQQRRSAQRFLADAIKRGP